MSFVMNENRGGGHVQQSAANATSSQISFGGGGHDDRFGPSRDADRPRIVGGKVVESRQQQQQQQWRPGIMSGARRDQDRCSKTSWAGRTRQEEVTRTIEIRKPVRFTTNDVQFFSHLREAVAPSSS